MVINNCNYCHYRNPQVEERFINEASAYVVLCPKCRTYGLLASSVCDAVKYWNERNERQKYVPERALRRLYKVECCMSCHDDEEEGYDALTEVDLGKGRYAYVCCVILNELHERKNNG